MRVRKRKCVFCGKVLSMYNPNPYCFADRDRGIDAIWTDKEKKVFAKYKAQLKYVEKKKKERQRAKRLSDSNNKPKRRRKRSVRAY